MAKNAFRDKLDGDVLDLSMMNLTEAPVKEIAALPRAFKIDLSSNQLVTLPASFATSLQHITRLELGSNKLCELPSNIGSLRNLKHLDVYNNQLTDLPVSLCYLKNLRWLDVKGNPLKNQLRKVAGDCLNQRECETAARNVLVHLKEVHAVMEREKQKKLKEEREIEARKQQQEEEERAKKRAEKKAARERRKAEALETHRAANGGPNAVQQVSTPEVTTRLVSQSPTPAQKSHSSKWSCLGLINMLLLMCLLASASVCGYLYTEGDLSMEGLYKALPRIAENASAVYALTLEAFQPANLQHTLFTVIDAVIETGTGLWASLEELTGDLSPYTTPVVQMASDAWHWTCDSLTFVCLWITTNVDFSAIWDGIKSSGYFLREQWLVVYEELGKNEALASATQTLSRQSDWLRSATMELMNTTSKHLSAFSIYIQQEGPIWIDFAKNQALSMYDSAKQSIEGMIN